MQRSYFGRLLISTIQGPDHNALSRDPSPSLDSATTYHALGTSGSANDISPEADPSPNFSIFGPTAEFSYLTAHRALPPLRQAKSLLDSYFRHLAWHGTGILHREAQAVVLEIYELDPEAVAQLPRSDLFTAFQKIALVLSLLAFGAHINPDFAPRNAESRRWQSFCEGCLVNGHFMSFHTLRGLQALSLLAKIYW